MLRRNRVASAETVMGQARSPRPDPTGLLARQINPQITDAAAAAVPMIAMCQEGPHAPQHGPSYSITSLALCWRWRGMLRPSALAVLRLMTRSNLTGAWTGRSLGFAPLRTRSA